MNRDQDPLDPPERRLADAPAKAPPGAHGAIPLRARRTAARSGAQPGSGRWPVALGAAAALVVAAGIAWQLRPGPGQAFPAAGGGASARQQSAAAVPAAADAAAASSRGGEDVSSRPAPAPEPRHAGPAAIDVGGAARLSAESRPSVLPTDAALPRVSTRSGSAKATADARPPGETAIGRRHFHSDPESRALPVRTLGTLAIAVPERARDDGDDLVFDREALHEDPPETVDSPRIHRAWLDRIRELRDAGELAAARDSLREYRRRYPGQPLPDDLDGLLSE